MSVPRKTEEELFEAARRLPTAEERARFLAEACAGDMKLRLRVEHLLSAAEDSGGFFSDVDLDEETLVMTAGKTAAPSEIVATTLKPGSKIGRYELIEVIGEGGFGLVYRAKQRRPVKREVALKIIKLGMDTEAVVGRFEAERQSLAMMEHPNIAKVLDAGATETGRPYFVMELVRGVPITDYCDRKRASTEERLRLFAEVCAAVQHAHQKGVIHRDIKPSNVLITEHDGKATPKVIDFGIAKATCNEEAEKAAFTQLGQFVGTPAYMSPEQARGNEVDIDTRSDIYSLGVLLYELLTGTTPFDAKDLRSAGFEEIRRRIREDDPPRPSLKVSTLGRAHRQTVAEKRQTESRSITRLLRGDLDWIVMKALEKDRDRRYETANGLRQDIQRYLSNEPVTASPPSVFYLVGKFAARNRAFLLSITAVALALVFGLVGMTLLFFESEANRATAQRNEGIAHHNAQLALTAQGKAEAARDAEQVQRQRAESESERRQKLLYAADMQLAGDIWESKDGTVEAINDLLTSHMPKQGEEDRRDFAWRYQWSLLNQASAITAVDEKLVTAAVTTNGTLLTLNRDLILREWNGIGTKPIRERALPLGYRYRDYYGFSPDGRQVVHVRTNHLRAFAADTGRQLLQVTNVPTPWRILFSPDNQTFAIREKTTWEVHTFDLKTGERGPVMPAKAPAGWREANALSPGGTNLVIGNYGHVGDLVLAYQNRKLRRIPSTHRSTVGQVAWSPDGRWIASGSDDGRVHLRSIDANMKTGTIRAFAPHSSFVIQLCFSPDSRRLATAARDGTVCLLELESGEVLHRWKAHIGDLRNLHFSADGRHLATSGNDGRAHLWDLDQPVDRERLALRHVGAKVVTTTNGNEVIFTGLANWRNERIKVIAGDLRAGDRIVGVRLSTNGPVHSLRHLRPGLVLPKIQGLRSSTFRLLVEDPAGARQQEVTLQRSYGSLDHTESYRICFSPDGRWLMTRSTFQLVLWDWTGDEPCRWLPYNGRSCAFSADSRWVVAHDPVRKEVGLWDIAAHRELKKWTFGNCGAVAISPDGKHVIAGLGWDLHMQRTRRQDTPIRVWSIEGTNRVDLMGHRRFVAALAFSPDGTRMASASHDGTVRLWKTSDWSFERRTTTTVGTLAAVTFSPDGKYVVAGGRFGNIYLFAADTGELVDTIAAHASQISDLEFSPDRRTLASSSRDETVKLWDFETRQQVRRLDVAGGVIHGLAFSPDGNALVSSALHSGPVVWRAAPLATIDRHPATTASMYRKGIVQLSRGPFDSAEHLLRRVYEIRKRDLGERHPLTIDASTALGMAIHKQERWDEVIALWEQATIHKLELYGRQSSSTRKTLNALLKAYRLRAAAADSSEQSLARSREALSGILGANDVVLTNLVNLPQ